MTRGEAVERIESWADEAESGNYHDFSSVLRAYAQIVKDGQEPEYLIIASYDDYPPGKNIIHLEVEV